MQDIPNPMHRQFSSQVFVDKNLIEIYRIKSRLQRTKCEESANEDKIMYDFDNHIETGFQFATFQGPLCAEPVEGMAYFVEQVDIDKEALTKEIGILSIS